MTLAVGDTWYRHCAEALGWEDIGAFTTDQVAVRNTLTSFIDRVVSLVEVPGSAVTYRPTELAVFASVDDVPGRQVEPTVVAWPLSILLGDSGGCVVVGGDDAQTLLDVLAGADRSTLFVQDGTTYEVAVRSLLPDQHTCADLTPWMPVEELEPEPGPELPPLPGEAILSDHSELTEGLHGLVVEVRITEPLGPGEVSPALCTHIAVGWSDCLNTDERTAAGTDLSVLVDDTGELEFWLLFDDTDVTRHRGYLGTVTVPTDGSVDTVALTIDTTGVTRDTLPTMSTDTQGRLQDVTFEMRRPEEAADANW